MLVVAVVDILDRRDWVEIVVGKGRYLLELFVDFDNKGVEVDVLVGVGPILNDDTMVFLLLLLLLFVVCCFCWLRCNHKSFKEWSKGTQVLKRVFFMQTMLLVVFVVLTNKEKRK